MQSAVQVHPPSWEVRLLRGGLGGLLALLLVGWLIASFSVLEAEVWDLLGRHPWAIGSIAMSSVFLMTLLSTVKWQLLLKRAAPDLSHSVRPGQLFAYTATSTALGQVLPAYVAGPAVRGLAMKTRHSADFARHAILAGYEQVFDIVVLVVGGLTALLLLLGGIAGVVGVMTFGVVIALSAPLIYVVARRYRPIRAAAALPRRWSVARRVRKNMEAGASAGLDAPHLLGVLTALSTLRYAVLVARTVGIGLILLTSVPWGTMVLGFGAVQLSALATLTPGNLGITELGWSGMTAMTDRATIGEFVAFALALRISGLASSAVLAAFSLLLLRRA